MNPFIKYYIKEEKIIGEKYYMIYVRILFVFNSFVERWNTIEHAEIRLRELNK